MKKLILVVLIVSVGALIKLAWPVYGFFAHGGKAPLPPWGWETIEGEPPVTQIALNPAFEEAGNNAVAALLSRRANISAPAYSAAVSVKGETVWQGAVGWANIAKDKPATPDTQFRIGSTSKALTATALARMVERNEIDLDAPITTYWPDIPNDAWRNITARQLASHSSGMPHYRKNEDTVGLYHSMALQKHFADVRDAVGVFDDTPLLFEPGTDFYYSSLGTVLLGAVMSHAADKPYRQIIQDEVLTPANMTATRVAPKRAKPTDALATFYLTKDGQHRKWRDLDLSHRLPGGGWASTPTDLVQLGALHLDGSYLSETTRDLFWTPQSLADGEVNEQDYAIGWRWREWEIEGLGVARNANHGGVSRGSQSWLLVFPDYQMAIAFNINTKTEEFADFGMVYQDLFKAFAPVAAEQIASAEPVSID